MKRFIIEKLVNWKNSKDRKPLILKGARQVGKTYILKEFGKENYKLQSKEYLIDSELYDYIDHKVIISETNGTYKSNLGGRGLDNPINFLPKVTITDDKVTIDYIYGNQGKKLTDVESIIGYTKMDTDKDEIKNYYPKEYNGNSLVLDKITYKENKEN